MCFLSTLFHHLSSQILGYLGALCCVGSDIWPGLPETAWSEPGVRVGPQIPYWERVGITAELLALKGLQKEEGEFRIPPPQVSGSLHCSQSMSGCYYISYGVILEESRHVHLVGGTW